MIIMNLRAIKLLLIITCLNACSNKESLNELNTRFLCDYLQQHKLLDGRRYIVPEPNESIEKYKDKLKYPDSLSPLVVHIWKKTINPQKFDYIKTISDSLEITSTKVPIYPEKFINVNCKNVRFALLDSLPKKYKDRGFFTLRSTPNIVVQISDMYLSKNKDYGVIHFIYTTGFLDNTFSDLIILKKENNKWVLKD